MTTTSLLLIIFFSLVVLGLIAFGAGIAWLYWWQISRAQPRIEGEAALPGLGAPVEILRDKHGVPHLYARSRADLLRAQGYTHAQDRFWQMEQSRRTASGTLAELFGEAALEVDRFTRVVGLRRAAEAELPLLDDATRQALEWYAEGVNAYLAARPGRIAPELNLLRARPASWTAADSLAIAKLTGWCLSLNWESELTRLRLLLQSDLYRAAELEPELPSTTPFATEAGGDLQTRLINAAGLMLNQLEPLKQWIGGLQAGQGSNAWVVAPSQSLTRKAVLANDIHLSPQIPGFWYENHLACPDLEVIGASIAGIPGVMAGHNEELAWGITNGGADQQDLYIERPHPDDPERFEFQGQWEQAQVIEENIRVRGRAQPYTERVVITRHGPLITQIIPEDARRVAAPLSLRWAGREAGKLLRAVLRLNEAASMEEARAALRDWDAPSMNFVLADARGNIGYQFAGRIPNRSANPGLVPAPGWTGDHEWQGYLAPEELPQVENPASGRAVTANNKPVGDSYPHFLGMDFDPGWRARRIDDLLVERDRYSIRDMQEIQLDTYSAYAADLVRWMTLLNSEDPWEKVSIQALRKWNLRMDPESTPALIYATVLLELLEMVFGDKLGAVRGGYLGESLTPLIPLSSHADKAQGKLLELLNNEDESFWYMEARTGRRRQRDELLQEALARAARRIRDLLGDSALKWQWGRVHQVSYAHPLGSARFLRGIFNRGPIPIGGDATTPLQTRSAARFPYGLIQVAPSYRQVIEVGAWDRMASVTPTGQSGHPFSANYDDQITMWREGVYHVSPWRREAVEKIATHKLVLRNG